MNTPNASVSSVAVPSLAILKVNWDRGRDYIENFVPFVADSLRHGANDEVSLGDVQSDIATRFGLNIPQGVLSTVLKRAAKHGLVERDQGILRRVNAALQASDLDASRADALRQYEGLLAKLVDFAKVRLDMVLEPEEADAMLLSYLEESSAAVLASITRGNKPSLDAATERSAEYVVGSFVLGLYESDPYGFEFLETIVKGSMLAGVLLYPDLGSVERHFDGVDIYFDTAFILQALGLEGAAREAPRKELLDLLYGYTANLCIFEHTLEEVRGVLDGAIRVLRGRPSNGRRFAPTIQYLVDAKYTASDVELIRSRLERNLRSLWISVKRRPDPTPLSRTPRLWRRGRPERSPGWPHGTRQSSASGRWS